MFTMKLKDIEFKNPIMTASGTFGYGDEISDLVQLSKFGAIITKSVTRFPREGNPPPRIHEVSSGMLNSIGLANLGVEKYIEKKIPFLNRIDTNVIINIAGTKIEDYIETLEMLEEASDKQVGYEINISCPNVKEGGQQFGVSSKLTNQLTKELRSRTKRILIMKLSPNVTSISEIAQSAEEGGADAVSAINTVSGMAVDIKNVKPVLNTIVGGLSGPAIKPIALANIYKIYQNIKIPIIGIGGISNHEDVIEFLLTGAKFIQLGTINYKFPNLVTSITSNLKDYIEEHSIDQIDDIVGAIFKDA